MEENLMDVKETAKYLGMNKMTVYKLARQEKIPAFKVASEWRFRKDLIDKWLMSQLKGKSGLERFVTEPRSETSRTVLIVDDEEIIRDFFTRTLKEYKVLTAASGEEALSIINKERADLVLLDIKMSGIDGIETLRQIRNIDKGIAVIMLSAFCSLKTNMEAARLGAYDSMSKPFDMDEIKAVINAALLNADKTKEPGVTLKKNTK